MKVSLLFLTAITLTAELVISKRHKQGKESRRILNGDFAPQKAFTYMVSLQKEFPRLSKFCGGVIIDSEWILTAGHCYDCELYHHQRNRDYFIKAGVVDAYENEYPAQNIRVSKIIQHPKYDANEMTNDLALLKLEEPLMFDEYVQPIELPPKNYISHGNGYILGWGAIDEEELRSSRFLRYATLSVADLSICQKYFGDITNKQICLGYENTQNACAGDSGGPFVQQINGKPAVVGVLSFGTIGCHEEDPIVYTRVAAFLDWILDTIKEN